MQVAAVCPSLSLHSHTNQARQVYTFLLFTPSALLSATSQGIEHLHHLRVVHGDLKPGNVLLKGSRVDVRGFNAQCIDFVSVLSHLEWTAVFILSSILCAFLIVLDVASYDVHTHTYHTHPTLTNTH